MPRINLTDRTVSGLHPLINGQVDYYDVKNPRFGVRISYNGTRTWFVFDIDPQTGKRRRITLGRYPEMTLAEARSASARLALQDRGRWCYPIIRQQGDIRGQSRRR